MNFKVQQYLTELIKRHAINPAGRDDQMLINYLRSQKIDEDYFKLNRPLCADCDPQAALFTKSN